MDTQSFQNINESDTGADFRQYDICSHLVFGQNVDATWSTLDDSWGNEKITTAVQNILVRKENIDRAIKSPSSDEILSKLRFEHARDPAAEFDCRRYDL